MVRWHHRLNGHESEQTLGDSEGRGAWHATVHGVAKSRTQFSNRITYTYISSKCLGIPLIKVKGWFIKATDHSMTCVKSLL